MNPSEQEKRLFEEFPPISTAKWEAQIEADLKGADYEKRLIWKTHEGLKVKPYYRAGDLEHIPFMNALPGEFPYVRGARVNHNGWEVRQNIYSDDITSANKMAVEAIERGAEGVGLMARQVNSLDDLANLIRYIELEKTAVHFTSSREYPFLAELFVQKMKLRTADKHKVHGSLAFDPFNYFLLHQEYYNSLQDNLNEAVYLLTKIREELPNFRMIHISGDVFHNAGAHAAQELAYALASGNEYLARLTETGLTVDQVAPAMHFTFAIGSNYFLEIAKIRAARMLWATIVNAYQPGNPESAVMYIHGTTSNWNKTIFDPNVNMLRSTTEAMAGAIAGCNSISVSPYDMAYKEADDLSVRLARNTQIILKEESYLDKVVDPSSGSYYIEHLTNAIATAAWDLFKKTEAEGGFLAAAESGAIKAAIEETSVARSNDIARRTTVVLGTNQYPNAGEQMLEKITAQMPQSYPGLTLYRGAEAFESLRLATERHVASGHSRPSVFLLNIGNLNMRKARASFATNFFGCAGYSLIDNAGFTTVDEGVQAALESQAAIVVVCSSDEEYGTLGIEITAKLKGSDNKPLVVVAGNPAEFTAALTSAGVDDFIHMRTNALESLQSFNKRIGIAG
jgi:methylmalonyl-CoA mutase